jgi:hypothetical protein
MSDGAAQRPAAEDVALIEARLGIEVAADPPGRRARRDEAPGQGTPTGNRAFRNIEKALTGAGRTLACAWAWADGPGSDGAAKSQ